MKTKDCFFFACDCTGEACSFWSYSANCCQRLLRQASGLRVDAYQQGVLSLLAKCPEKNTYRRIVDKVVKSYLEEPLTATDLLKVTKCIGELLAVAALLSERCGNKMSEVMQYDLVYRARNVNNK